MFVEIKNLRLQAALAGKGKQALRQPCAHLDRVERAAHQLAVALVGQTIQQQFKIAADHCKKIVEIMRDTARELAIRLHALGLQQLFLGLFPALDLGFQSGRAFADAALKLMLDQFLRGDVPQDNR
jgi:hypothetical protein